MAATAALVLALVLGLVAVSTAGYRQQPAGGVPVSAVISVNTASAVDGFVVTGSLDRPLTPGASAPVRLRIASRRTTPIWVTALTMSAQLDRDSVARGCNLRRDYQLLQLPRRAFPIQLRRARKRRGRRTAVVWTVPQTTAQLGRPALSMRDLPGVNQDACKGARLTLKFSGRATNRPPRRSRAMARGSVTQGRATR